jgi:ABC-type transporter MlaC component
LAVSFVAVGCFADADVASGVAAEKSVSDAAYAKSDPRAVVTHLANSAIEIINRHGVTRAQVTSSFMALLRECFSVESIAKSVIGINFRNIDIAKRPAFYECFMNMLVKFYSSRFVEYKKSTFAVKRVMELSKGYRFIVNSELHTGGSVIKVDWSVFVVNGVAKIFDVIIDGVSMSNIQHAGMEGSIRKMGFASFLSNFMKENMEIPDEE